MIAVKAIIAGCVAVIAVSVSGCDNPWGASDKNDIRIAEYKKCLEADMRPYMNYVGEIVCGVPDDKQ